MPILTLLPLANYRNSPAQKAWNWIAYRLYIVKILRLSCFHNAGPWPEKRGNRYDFEYWYSVQSQTFNVQSEKLTGHKIRKIPFLVWKCPITLENGCLNETHTFFIFTFWFFIISFSFCSLIRNRTEKNTKSSHFVDYDV